MTSDIQDRLTPGRFVPRVILPIALLVVLALGIGAAFVGYAARVQDMAARTQATAAVREAVALRLSQIGKVTKDYAWWDDAVRYLTLAPDADWADSNIGDYLNGTHGFEMSLVLRPSGEVTYASRDGRRRPAREFEGVRHGLARLAAEARRAPPREPNFVTGLLSVDGAVVLAAASAVTPEERSTLAVAPEARSVLVVMKRLGPAFLAELVNIAGIKNLVLDGPVQRGRSVVPLRAVDGEVIGRLIWRPARPGTELLRAAAPSMAVAAVILVLFTLLILRHARSAARSLQMSEARFRDVADATSDWIWETDAALRVRFLSRRFAGSMGIDPERVIGAHLGEVLAPADLPGGWDRLQDGARPPAPFRNLVCVHRDRDGPPRTLRVAGTPVFDAKGRYLGCRGTATDITDEMEARKRAHYLASHDALTRLPNRVLLSERLEQAVIEARHRGDLAAVLCLDLDRFKEVNDTLGHGVGDRLLQTCAERIGACVGARATVARMGGDEFAVVRGGVERRDDVQRICRRLLRALARPFDVDGHEILVSASIGVAFAPEDGATPEALLQRADIALYHSKSSGRNAFHMFHAGMDAKLRRRKTFERELRQAFAAGDLELHYQPKIALNDSRVVGAEALLRWPHEGLGLIAPREFISVAEETGLILPIGEWVLETACARAVAWPGMTVAVNVSSVQFQHRGLVRAVRRALDASGLGPERLELEVTESVFLQNGDEAVRTLGRLRDVGVRIVVDDFGTGYASLSYLERFTFDKIKVDRSFIDGLGRRPHAEAIVHSILGLARSLAVPTCAEGIETFDQLAFLREGGCDEGQGHLFSEPVPAPEVERLFVMTGTAGPGSDGGAVLDRRAAGGDAATGR